MLDLTSSPVTLFFTATELYEVQSQMPTLPSATTRMREFAAPLVHVGAAGHVYRSDVHQHEILAQVAR
jgi:hypothetical protein